MTRKRIGIALLILAAVTGFRAYISFATADELSSESVILEYGEPYRGQWDHPKALAHEEDNRGGIYTTFAIVFAISGLLTLPRIELGSNTPPNF